MSRPVVWTVAGSDSGGGAGLQADLRAFEVMGVHGCCAVTAVTAQNSRHVHAVQPVAPEWLSTQLSALAEDLPPAVIKVGLLGSAEQARLLAQCVRRLREHRPVALVVDPVWRASSGAGLAGEALRAALCSQLLPLADVITPNRAEAAWLLGERALQGSAALQTAAKALQATGAASVVITGGDAQEPHASDWLHTPQAIGELRSARLPTHHTHGSGCSFAAGLAAALALGFCEADAAVLAKALVSDALAEPQQAGQGSGPVRPRPGFAGRVAAWPVLHPLDNGPAPCAAFARCGDGALGLYPVVDRAEAVAWLAHAGVHTVQLRIKQADAGTLDREVAHAVQVARAHGLRLFINDHWQLALRHQAYGVHLGQEDLVDADLPRLQAAGLRLGVSSHAPWEVARALAVQPSYIACGPVHPTQTKAMPWQPQGLHNLRFWSALLPLPVVAIGGLTPDRAREARAAGADGCAVLSGLAGEGRDAALQRYREALQCDIGSAPPVPSLPRPTLPRAAPARCSAGAEPRLRHMPT